MIYLIGLGLGGPKDITIRGLNAMSECEILVLESYTSLYTDCINLPTEITQRDYDKIQEQYIEELLCLLSSRKNTLPKILMADRYCIEQACFQPLHQNDVIYEGALNLSCATTLKSHSNDCKERNIGILVVGDPLSATTHTDLILKCRHHKVQCQIIHNTSIMTAIGKTGLFLYHFGPSVSIPFFTKTWRPSSFYCKILENHQRNLHTLCLLDIKIGEPTEEALAKWKPGRSYSSFQPPRFMTIQAAIEQLFSIENDMNQGVATPSTIAIGVARLGSHSEVIKMGTLESLFKYDFGSPLHALVFPANINSLHESEKEMINLYQ